MRWWRPATRRTCRLLCSKAASPAAMTAAGAIRGADRVGHWPTNRRFRAPGTTRSEVLRALLVLPVGDEIVDHSRIGQRRGVAEIGELVLGDLAQDAAHDL